MNNLIIVFIDFIMYVVIARTWYFLKVIYVDYKCLEWTLE